MTPAVCASAALRQLRNTSHIEDDVEEMKAEDRAQQAEARITMAQLLRSPSLRSPLLIAIIMQLSQQLSGINAVSRTARLPSLDGVSCQRLRLYCTAGLKAQTTVRHFCR